MWLAKWLLLSQGAVVPPTVHRPRPVPRGGAPVNLASPPPPPRLPTRSLQDMMGTVNSRLRAQPLGWDGSSNELAAPPRSTERQPFSRRWASEAPPAVAAAWVVVCKPLVRGQMTLEHAARVHAAVRMLSNGQTEVPSIICFCGGELMECVGVDRWLAASAGYSFFCAAAEAQGVDLSSTTLIVETQTAMLADGLLEAAVKLRGAAAEIARAGGGGGVDGGHGGGGGGGRGGMVLAPMLMRLFWTDHKLQRLRDIESLSPSRAPPRKSRSPHALPHGRRVAAAWPPRDRNGGGLYEPRLQSVRASCATAREGRWEAGGSHAPARSVFGRAAARLWHV